jgi:hypothetical protein
MSDAATRFDEDYYRRYYEDAGTAVHDAAKIAHLARGITEMVAWFGGSLDAVLDVGAGAGLWRDWFARHYPKTKYRSTEYSAYACEKYGHEQRDISAWRARERFDLVICQGVLQYIPTPACASAIDNLGAMTRGFLYLEAITKRDLEEICDQDKTDGAVHLRTAAWYRTRLARHFVPVGCGLYYSKRGSLQFYELERGGA